MKITGENSQAQILVYQQQSEKIARTDQANAGKNASTARQSDSISISSDATMLAEANRVARETPDVREDKVARLREQVQNGTYTIDNTRIAEGILKEDSSIFGL